MGIKIVLILDIKTSKQKLPNINLLLQLHPQSITKIVRLAPVTLYNVGCKFAWSFLATTAWHSFSRFTTTLNEGETWNYGYL